MKTLKLKYGFTLIELLIVITIVGILSTVVMSSVNSARIKAYDSKVKQQLYSFRSAAELYFSNRTPNSYGPTVGDCLTANTIFTNTNVQDGNPALYLDFSSVNPGVTIVCGANNGAYSVKATLASGGFFCVDSKGSAKIVLEPIGASAVQCPE